MEEPTIVEKPLAKPNALLSGFYLAKFNLAISATLGSHIALTELPSAGSAIPLYVTPKNPWALWIDPWDHLYMGLACSRTGQLYTIDYADDGLCTINKTNGTVSELGKVDINFCNDFDDYWYYTDEFVNLEFNHATNQLYCIEANDWTWDGDSDYYSDLYELNPADGTTLAADGAPGARPHMWTIGGGGGGVGIANGQTSMKKVNVGFNYDHFVTGLQIPVCGVFLAAPNPLSEFFAGESSTANAGQTYEIKWFAYNVDNRVKLEYSTDGGNFWILIADQVYTNEIPGFIYNYYDLINPNSYTWTVPFGLPNQIQIKVSKASDPFFWDANTLNIINPVINPNNGRLIITDPNGGEKLAGGSFYYIKWIRYGGGVSGQIALEYSSDGGQIWNKITTTPLTPILMRYYWQVPKINSNNCLVRIVNNLSRREYDRSDNLFTIVSAGTEKNIQLS